MDTHNHTEHVKLPEGIVSFLFSDIEGSTRLAQQFPDTLQHFLEKHNKIMFDSIVENGGYVFELVGDAFCAAFHDSQSAVKAALEAQTKLNSEDWGEAVIKVRMGIHTGEAKNDGRKYSGYITLARTQRIMSAAHGGQVLVSNDVFNDVNKEFTFRDLGERRLKDLRQTERLFQFTYSGLPSDFPPLNTLDARPNNLPVQLTTFVGREKEISDIKALLVKTHLLTLIGAGGTGKTRIALQSAADMIDDFENGVWFVDLAPLLDPELLPQTIAEALDVKEDPRVKLSDTLCDYLKDKEMLIILDNCEQLIEATSKLVEKLLQSSPKLKIIATSREALRITGEQTLKVSSLSLPDPQTDNTLEKLEKFESVKLFIDRAVSVNQNFKVTDDNAGVLAEICFRLDGIPLAIELAAARVKVLSLDKINDRLNDRFKLLTGGERTALPRRQTLRALIDWSYELLSENEKILWRRLAVFSGGWSLESAEKVCGEASIDEADILDLLNNLIEKSIIIFDEVNDRYRMLETIKQYGSEKLTEFTELKFATLKHLEYFLLRAEEIKAKLSGVDLKIQLDKLEEDYPNYQAALSWSVEEGKRLESIRLAIALCKYWHIKGFISEGRKWLSVLSQRREDIPKPMLASVLNYLGVFDYAQGEYARAEEELLEAFEIRKESGDKRSIADGLNILGLLAYEKGDYEKALEYHEECLKLQRENSDKLGIAISINNLGLIYQDLKKKENEADEEALYKEGLQLFREAGDSRRLATFLNFLGNVFLDKNEFDAAQKYYEESLNLFKELGNKRGIAFSLGSLSNLARNQRDFSKAKKLLEESLLICESLGDKLGMAITYSNLGEIMIYMNDHKQAGIFLEKGLRMLLGLGNYYYIAINLLEFVQLHLMKNDFDNSVILMGSIENALAAKGAVFETEINNKFEKTISVLKEKIPEARFSELFEKGKSIQLNEAARIALS